MSIAIIMEKDVLFLQMNSKIGFFNGKQGIKSIVFL